MYLICACFKTFVATEKKNPACLNNLVHSIKPANIGKKQPLLRKKGNVIKCQVRKYRSAFPKNLKSHQIIK